MRGRSFATRRENCNGCQHIGGVIRSLIAAGVAVVVYSPKGLARSVQEISLYFFGKLWYTESIKVEE